MLLDIINYTKEWGNILDKSFDICDNDMQYPELHKRHSNVDGDFIIHKLPKDGAVQLHELTQY